MSKTEYIKTFHGYQIYVIPEAYVMHVAGKVTGTIDRYVAIKPDTHQIIDDVTIGSLESGIVETER